MSKSRFDHVCQSVALFIRYIFPYELNLGCRYFFNAFILLRLKNKGLFWKLGTCWDVYYLYAREIVDINYATINFFILQSSLSAQQKKKFVLKRESREEGTVSILLGLWI